MQGLSEQVLSEQYLMQVLLTLRNHLGDTNRGFDIENHQEGWLKMASVDLQWIYFSHDG